MQKWSQNRSNSKYNMGQGHVEQVHRVKGARNELEMVPAVTKQEIPHMVKISAQSEQLCERYSKFNWFLKIACLRYEGPWGRDCVSGVRPCLVHSQKLSELIVHFDGGQNPYRTAVRPSALHMRRGGRTTDEGG